MGSNGSRSKERYRVAHNEQRLEKLRRNEKFLKDKGHFLLQFLANGDEVEPSNITPQIELIRAGTVSADLFRYATLYWSIPVSEGYGRRMRFLVRDASNGKLIGLFALGDAVFNLKPRDEYIGWSGLQRRQKLVNLMDAYVVGALPPYNFLLGGKLVAALIKSREVVDAFRKKYKSSTGVISGESKNPYLTAVTVTSALGRSSIYNRLRLSEDHIFKKIGYTNGWGHFHITEDIFRDIEEIVLKSIPKYEKSYEFGHGPNWRIRLLKDGFKLLGLNPSLMNHGYQREVFISELCTNFREVLSAKRKVPDYSQLRNASEIGSAALARWVMPRAHSRPDYLNYKREQFLADIGVY